MQTMPNIADVTLIDGACVRANDQFAGGIAGSNRAGNGQNGTITGCTNNAGPNGNNYTVYATNGNAGGIAGSNESGAQIVDSVVGGVKIGVAKCDAAAIAANNFGIITGGTVGSCDITFAGESIGAVTAINNAGATINNVTLDGNANIAFHGPATNVGGIAGKNAGTIGGCKVEQPCTGAQRPYGPGGQHQPWRCGGRQYAGRKNQRNNCYTEHYRQSE